MFIYVKHTHIRCVILLLALKEYFTQQDCHLITPPWGIEQDAYLEQPGKGGVAVGYKLVAGLARGLVS